MSAQDDAATLVSMSVAELAAHLDGMDVETLTAALAVENAREGGPRKGALAALNDALAGHPENAVTDAASAGDLEDAPADAKAISSAPPRPHQALVDSLDLIWNEAKAFVSRLEGQVDGDLGEFLNFVRSKL
jgi:hypothetical protein